MPLPNNQIADCSDQAHIFISDRRINPDGTQDTRPFDTVVNDGLLPGFNILDAIHPLSQTILHEWVHVAGGLEDPSGRAGGRAVITDGPSNGVYGYGACLDASYDQFKFGWPSTTLFADQYVLLAKS
ncbi:hypothetical protein QBC33DRAFT_571852 [Phialemonium atrogriseum]|uniref:Uncharacterized protein n=1 Tax=Phialemonium atrogriseum TaxID=1093897 RepID=A0AAJ0C0A2_9PEZI|nr:uncharacterized protein QBC33DRAFT_571852 [Phialemonium atrogriseum]KAK1765306.1 hypothetical protein QBC33DRAFT_571852 [Phialemonium atrogriseum]